MTYLSQLSVGKTEAARLRLRDAYAWHQKLWELFPEQDGEPRTFLFRLDDSRSAFRVLLLSPQKPAEPPWAQIATKQVAESFLDHSRYRFQLKANPTMRRSSDRRRLGIYAEDRLRAWMQRKAELNGFALELDTLSIGGPQEEVFSRGRSRGKHVGVDFQGILCVQDREAFSQAFQHGIGSAKSFGFGLLMLQPVK